MCVYVFVCATRRYSTLSLHFQLLEGVTSRQLRAAEEERVDLVGKLRAVVHRYKTETARGTRARAEAAAQILQAEKVATAASLDEAVSMAVAAARASAGGAA